MSSRQLRKLRRQQEQDQAGATVPDVESSADEVVPVAKPRVSLFAALGGDDEPEEQEGEDDMEQEPEPVEEEHEVVPVKSKKNKKKKKKKKAKAKAQKVEDEGDEIDKAMKELNIKPLSSQPKAATATAPQNTASLFSINTHHLKALNEMRAIFGRDVISTAAADESEAQRERLRQIDPRQLDLETFLHGLPGEKKLSEVSLRRNIFIQGREHWPRGTSHGLTMQETRQAEDASWTEYTFAYDRQYDRLQMIFFACVQMHDPMRMVHLLKDVPYHVSTLLQVSSIAKQDQNMALAAELCERALFSFGRVTTPGFRQNLEQGKARLDFRRPENRQFWLAGYHYIRSLIRKGTCRTGLEWAKLLYSLDPRDPYAMRHFIPSLAVKAHEAEWLVDFLGKIENRDAVYLRQSAVLAKLQLGDAPGARADLVAGMRQVPWLYSALFQELNLDTPPSIWGIMADSHARQFSVKLYIHQNKDVWNNSNAINLLQDVAKSIDKVDTSLLPSDDPQPGLGSTRLAYLEGQTSLIAVAPRQFLERQPNYEFDPLPPREEDNVFTTESTRLPWKGTMRIEQETSIRNFLDRNAALALAAGAGAAFPAALGGGEPGGDDEDFDDPELNLDNIEWDHDPPAEADGTEAEIPARLQGPNPQRGANAIYQLLMRQLGRQTGDPQAGGEDADLEPDLEPYLEGGVPGAWPLDDTDSQPESDDGHARNRQH